MLRCEAICEGLKAETSYRFRVVVKDGEGVTGADRVFATYGRVWRPA